MNALPVDAREPKAVRVDGVDAPPPRLIGVPVRSSELSPWEKSVVAQLTDTPARPSYHPYRRRDGGYGIRFAQPVLNGAECLRCHSPPTPFTGPYARLAVHPAAPLWLPPRPRRAHHPPGRPPARVRQR